MQEPRQMNEDGLDVREANHRMMNMLAISRKHWLSTDKSPGHHRPTG
jgi:hypothetical protein